MASLYEIRALADHEAEDVSRSPKDWMNYLDTASRLYRYSFSDTLLIHAQRPSATACASLELWNEKMGRWVNRGAKGIALIDESGPRRRVRYVFDIRDTHLGRGGRTPNLWKLEERHRGALLNHLADIYGLEGDNRKNLTVALGEVASIRAQEYMLEAKMGNILAGLYQGTEGTKLADKDHDTIFHNFWSLLENSAFYSLCVRCGLNPLEYLEEAEYAGITDFNSLSVLTFLGNAVSELVEPVLIDIGRTVERLIVEEPKKEVAKPLHPGYNKFNTLKRESITEEGEREDGTDVPQKGRLPVSEPGPGGRERDGREIRDAAPDVSEGTQERMVSEHVIDGETGPVSDGSGENGRGTAGSPDEWTPETPSGSGQGDRTDGVGSIHEQSEGDSGREHPAGIGIQLTEETDEQALSEAEEEMASALSLPELPSVEEQKWKMEEGMQTWYVGKTAIPADVVDEVLRRGGG